ncbi:precorrin-6A/cobalt-precorrin-6A reductase [Jannaschia sp. LMIT008]|uniref:precorrin-6A/cobalt-precorrin-6A reductase n=1 Tax=Jannaschia maritima TaxID=3032585 RepID=UPI0028114DA4|nr:precorrin-6A/cobalt-precorrin-6A reductase [Jannaschia sp. LMIT008]
MLPRPVLILAGTREARALCGRAAAAGLDVLASLAGRTARPDLGVPVRVGGFGGDDGFRAALAGVGAVLDATHPFAATMSRRAATICAAEGVPHLRLTRPPWPVEPGWRLHPDAGAVARAIPPDARLLIASGPGTLDALAGAGARRWCRRVDPAPPDRRAAWIVGLPADEDVEVATMRDLDVTHLVAKNSGGSGRAKLDAARRLGVAVHMIERPPVPAAGEETHDPERAFAFLRAHADHPRSG